MKRILMVLAATVICGASLFTSCNKDKEDNNQTLAEQLVGKWIYIEADGQRVETAESSVTTFALEGSTLKAYTSISLQDYGLWDHNQPTEVTIDGDKVTLTMHQGDLTTVEEMTDITVSGDELRYTSHYTFLRGGEVILEEPIYQLRCTKVHDDYSQIIVGRCEGTVTSDEPGFEPVPFCVEYLADGTLNAYQFMDGQWQAVATDFAEYFVDGTLLCTRWQYPGSTEQRLNVICLSFENGTLVTQQTAERNGHLYTYTYTSTVTQVNG